MSARIQNHITGRLSLRPPQAESLTRLKQVLDAAPEMLSQVRDVAAILSTLKAEFSVLECLDSRGISEEENPFELLQGWEWAQLADLVALVTDGDHQAPPTAESGIPFLVIGNLNTGDISLKNCRFVPEEYYENWIGGKNPLKMIFYTQ